MRARFTTFSKTRIEIALQGRPQRVYWETPEETPFKLSASERANFLALAAFPFAMRRGVDLEIDGEVDRQLARNLAQFSMAWCQFRPSMFQRPVRVIPTGYKKPAGNGPGDAAGFTCAYSGGIDSTFVISHSARAAGMEEFPRVSQAIIIDGFGFDLERPENFEATLASGREYCGSLGVPLTWVRTNWAKVLGAYQLFHTIGIAAVLHTRAPLQGGGYIGMDFTFDEEFAVGAWGNSALNSRMFCSSNFTVVPAGGELPRISKLKLLHEYGHSRYLKVCNSPGRVTKNCGRCEKCQRTMLAFRAAGLEPPAGLFGADLKAESVSRLEITKLTQWVFYNRMEEQWADRSDPMLEIVRNLISKARENGFRINADHGEQSREEWTAPERVVEGAGEEKSGRSFRGLLRRLIAGTQVGTFLAFSSQGLEITEQGLGLVAYFC